MCDRPSAFLYLVLLFGADLALRQARKRKRNNSGETPSAINRWAFGILCSHCCSTPACARAHAHALRRLLPQLFCFYLSLVVLLRAPCIHACVLVVCAHRLCLAFFESSADSAGRLLNALLSCVLLPLLSLSLSSYACLALLGTVGRRRNVETTRQDRNVTPAPVKYQNAVERAEYQRVRLRLARTERRAIDKPNWE